MKLLPLIFLLTSCAANKIDRRIYQPSVIFFPPNSKIQTTEGFYITDPKAVEKWYSALKYEGLEAAYTNK